MTTKADTNAPLEAPPAMAPSSELPTLLQLELASHEVDAYLHELEGHAQLHEVRVKGAPTAHSAAAGPDLATFRLALQARTIRAAQLLYTLEGAIYCDTLLASGPEKFRLIRRLPAAPFP